MTSGATGHRLLVTGASGFVGRYLCSRLVDAGYRVRGLSRRGRPDFPASVEAVLATDLNDRDGVRRAIRGCHGIVHLAARVHVMHDRDAHPERAFYEANVDGTRVLLEEAVRAGVTRFVFASTVKAMGEVSDRPWTEADEPRPAEPYGASKLAAERLLKEFASPGVLHASVLRLPLVYGPGVRANMLRLFRLVDQGVPLPLGGVRNRRSVMYVGNVAAAIQHVLERSTEARAVYFASDEWDPSTPELIHGIARALDRPVRLLPCPERALRLAARGGDLIAPWVRVPLTSRALDRLLGSLQVDVSRLRATGFVPPFTPAEGLRATAAWYRARG